MGAIENELKTCSPDYELTIDIAIIEDQTKPIPEIMDEKKWDKLKKAGEI